jgi:uncharacterized membrane protein (UPF0127 family)
MVTVTNRNYDTKNRESVGIIIELRSDIIKLKPILIGDRIRTNAYQVIRNKILLSGYT